MSAQYRIDWLGNVIDPRHGHRVGVLVCGPDARGYTLRIHHLNGVQHVHAENIEIQLTRSGDFVPGTAVGVTATEKSVPTIAAEAAYRVLCEYDDESIQEADWRELSRQIADAVLHSLRESGAL